VADAQPVAARTLHLTVDVRIDGDEISGDARDDGGQPTSFRGWLGLIGALDGLLSAPSADREPTLPITRPPGPEGRQ
jgi:hypothetical protein